MIQSSKNDTRVGIINREGHTRLHEMEINIFNATSMAKILIEQSIKNEKSNFRRRTIVATDTVFRAEMAQNICENSSMFKMIVHAYYNKQLEYSHSVELHMKNLRLDETNMVQRQSNHKPLGKHLSNDKTCQPFELKVSISCCRLHVRFSRAHR